MPRRASSEIDALTSVRGIAAVWVAAYHGWPLLASIDSRLSEKNPLAGLGNLAVPVFFVLSGYVLGMRYLESLRSPSWPRYKRFLALRLGRVYPVHFVVLAFSVLLLCRHGWPSGPAHTPALFVANVFLVQAWRWSGEYSWYVPAWSISAEWFAYLVFPLVARAVSSTGRRWLLALTAVCAALEVGAYVSAVPFQLLARMIPAFVGGVALSRAAPPGALARAGVANAGSYAIVLGVVTLPFVWSAPAALVFVLASSFPLVVLLASARSRLWSARPLVFLGDVSYSFYMVHTLVYTMLTRFHFFEPAAIGPARVAMKEALVAALLLGVTVAMHYVVEKPMREWTRRRMSGHQRAPAEGATAAAIGDPSAGA